MYFKFIKSSINLIFKWWDYIWVHFAFFKIINVVIAKIFFILFLGHIQYISTIIKDERKIYRKRYGVQFFLDTIRRHYASPDMVASDDRKAIRVSLLGLIKYYLQKECNVKELSAIMGFLATCKEEILVSDIIGQ